MGKIIAVVNQKGGVGKTTTAVNLTAALKELGTKVLLCDFDPQANATSGFGVEKRKVKASVYDVLINDTPAADAVIHTDYGDLLPSSADLAGAGVELVSLPDPHHRLKNALEKLRDSYDLILIDCPPSLEMLTMRILRLGGPDGPDVHPADGEEKGQSGPGHFRRGPDHVRRPDQLLRPGGPGSPAAFSRKSLRHSHSPERPAGGSPQPRSAGNGL